MSKVFEVAAISVDPEHRNDVLNFFKTEREQYNATAGKHGGCIVGMFECVAGSCGITEFVNVVRWDTLQGRQACMMEMMQDPHHRELFKKVAKFMRCRCQWVGDAFDAETTPAVLDDAGPVMMSTLGVKGHPMECAAALKARNQEMLGEIKMNLPLTGLIVPTLIYSCYNLIAFCKANPEEVSNAYPNLQAHIHDQSS